MGRRKTHAVLVGACLSISLLGSLGLAGAAFAKPTWLPATALTEATGVGTPAAAIGASGAGTIVWEDASERVEAASRMAFGGGFAPAVAISPSGEKAEYPRVAEDGAGVAIVVWMNDSVGAIDAATVTDGVAAAPTQISAAGATTSFPTIAVNESGAAIAAWMRYDEEGEYVIEASLRPAGGTFDAPVTLAPEAGNSEFPQATIDDAGEAIVAWTRDTSPSVVEASTSTASGKFSAATVLSKSAEEAKQPSVAMNAAGDGAVAWTEASASSDVARIATRSAGGAFGAPLTVSAATAGVEYPQVGLDASGEPTVAWMNASYVEVAEGPAAGPYSAPERIAFPALFPSLSEDEAGAAVLAWVDGNSKVADASFRPAGADFEATRTVSPGRGEIQDDFAPGHPPVASAIDGGGDGLAAFALEGGAGPYAALLDAAGPVLDGLSIPATGVAGKPVAFSVAPADQISSVAATTWSFGDATSASGASVSHTFATSGTYSVSVTSTDASGNQTVATGKIVISAEPLVAVKESVLPKFKGARLISRSVRASRGGGMRLKVRCPADHDCKGKVTLTLKARVGKLPVATFALGKDKFKAGAGARAYVTFQLRPALLKLLREDRKLKFSATIESSDVRSQTATTTANGKLKAPKVRKHRKHDGSQ